MTEHRKPDGLEVQELDDEPADETSLAFRSGRQVRNLLRFVRSLIPNGLRTDRSTVDALPPDLVPAIAVQTEATATGALEIIKPRFERNDIPMEIAEVPRRREVDVIGDLNGSAQALLDNFRALNLIADGADLKDLSTIIWIGDDHIVVELGDILMDRKQTSHLAMVILRHLEPQIKTAGGDLVSIDGNHDDIAFSLLSNNLVAGRLDIFKCLRVNAKRVLGIMEFFQYSSYEGIQKAKSLEDFMLELPLGSEYANGLELAMADILENMRNDKNGGRALLEQMCRRQLAEYIDDTVYVHTDPTPEMLDYFLQDGVTIGDAVDKINEDYQAGRRAYLLSEGDIPESFDQLRSNFLDADNRTSKGDYLVIQEKLARLRAKGMNIVFHGHTPPLSPNSSRNPIFESASGAKIVNVDFGFGLDETYQGERSVARLMKKNGKIKVGPQVMGVFKP